MADPRLTCPNCDAVLEEVNRPFDLAVVLVEYAEWLAESERPGEADELAARARPLFERLRAAPWVERIDTLQLRLAGGVVAS
jgi:hypothetical protein